MTLRSILSISKLLKQDNHQMVSMLFNYFEQLFNHKKLDKVDWKSLDNVRTEKEMTMFLESLEEHLSKIRYEGKIEGKIEGKLEIVKAMLVKGVDIDFILEVTGLSKEELEQLKH